VDLGAYASDDDDDDDDAAESDRAAFGACAVRGAYRSR
jgi:hypothetical protein